MSEPSLSSARAIVGLSAAGTATRPLVAGTVNIGQPQLTIPFPDCDIAFTGKALLSDTQTASVDLTTLAVTPSTSATANASGTLEPSGANNNILITSNTGGPNPTTVALAIDSSTDQTQLSAVKTGDALVVTSGDKRRMIVTADFGDGSETIPLIYAGTSSGEELWTDTGEPTGNAYGIRFSATECELAKLSAGTFQVEPHNVDFPDEVDFSEANTSGGATGTPTVTASPATAAQTIAAINSGSFGITASNATGNDGTGAIAAVTAVSLTGALTREWVGPQLDFQGAEYLAPDSILAMFVRVVSGECAVVTAANDTDLEAGGFVMISGSDLQASPGTISLTASADDTVVEVVVLASS